MSEEIAMLTYNSIYANILPADLDDTVQYTKKDQELHEKLLTFPKKNP